MSVGEGSTRGGVDAGEFVSEDGDADAGAAGEESASFDGSVAGGGTDEASYFGADGVVFVGAEIVDVDVERTEVSDESVFESAAK